MRTDFENQLKTLHKQLTQMGNASVKAIEILSESLNINTAACIAPIAHLSEDVDILEKQAETLCLKLLLKQQPVAKDLRQISAALKILTDIKRISDQILNISEIIPLLKSTNISKTVISQMAVVTSQMLKKGINAYILQDEKLAKKAIACDDIVDEYFIKIRTELVALIVENPNNASNALDLIMIAKYFERIGDHAANIAGWVLFSVTGKHQEVLG